MRILYISRKHPPSVGGMEKVSYEIHKRLSKLSDVESVIWGGSNKWLFIILPFFVLKSVLILLTKRIDVIYLADGSISPIMLFVMIFKKPIVVTIHALDITYKNGFYQRIIPRCVKRADRVICVSNYTEDECKKRGISDDRIVVIKNGISDDFFIENKNITDLGNELEGKLNISLKNKKIIFSTGRLIERKGFHWFTREVVPEILKKRKDFVYIIAGSGKFENEIRTAIDKSGLEDVVIMAGRVSDETLKELYNSADVFVMPNIRVEGDAEGFGLVALEAASCGLPVVASDLEGIKDALEDNKTGFLVEPLDKAGYADIINELLENGSRKNFNPEISRNTVLKNYDWNIIVGRYLEEFRKLLS
ncbi:MAG: glycosyltransferase family 4 protein [Minisyncoccia bacterium]